MKIYPIIITFFLGWLPAFCQVQIAEDKVVVHNETKINSEDLEYSPTFYKDGLVFVTTRSEHFRYKVKDKNTDLNVMSVYRAQRDSDGFLKDAEIFAMELTTRMNEGPMTFDITASTIFFTQNNRTAKGTDGKRKLQIYEASQSEGEWGESVKLNFNVKDYNFLHPTISVNGDTLYFASDLPGGFGGMDLYYAKKEGKAWSEPRNLGPEVNSSGNDLFPFFHADGTLYYASDGHAGLGNLDIFYTYFEEENWEKPQNLGIPFNSPKDDFGFILDRDNQNGYFTSSRPGGMGADDIYSFYIIQDEENKVAKRDRRKNKEMQIAVKDEAGNNLEGAEISYYNLDEMMLNAGENGTVKLQPNGSNGERFILDVNPENSENVVTTDVEGLKDLKLKEGNYVVNIKKPGYITTQILITPETDLNNLEIQLEKAVNCISLSGKVFSEGSMQPMSATKIHIVDVETNDVLNVYTDEEGKFEYCIPCDKAFSIYATKNGIASPSEIANTKKVNCTESAALNLLLYLSEASNAVAEGTVIELPNIYFNFDDATLRPDAQKDLDAMVSILKENSKWKIELASHTDARGTLDYNWRLSQNRSDNVVKYLQKKGIAAKRLRATGYGESQILNQCLSGTPCPENLHQENRRTEIKIISNGQKAPKKSKDDDTLFADKQGQKDQKFINQSPPEEALVSNENLEKVAGNFLVIAGTFGEQANAKKRLQKINSLGFENASIIQLYDNKYHAVCVKEFEKENLAEQLVQQLKKKEGIKAYVRGMNDK